MEIGINMKNALILLCILWGIEFANAACSTPITRTNSSPNTVLTSTKYNTDLNTVYTKVNDLDGDCITDASIATAKLENGSVTSAKLATGAIANLVVVSKTANYTADDDDVILGDATSGAITITLPTAVGISGKEYVVKKTDASTNAVILDAAGAETIDGEATLSIGAKGVVISVVSNGSNWIVSWRSLGCISRLACNNVFSFKATSGGTVSDDTLDWINGNGAVADTSRFTYTVPSGIFTVAPTCVATTAESGVGATFAKVSSVSTTSVVIRTYNSAPSYAATAHHVVCTKTDTDTVGY
jgi:hypothetical protein